MSIENLNQKLSGELPVTREELIILVDSWGRYDDYQTKWLKEQKECYDLSKLDVSQITNMDSIFKHSLFNNIHSTNGIGLHNGYISQWNTSKVTSMKEMFYNARNFNQPVNFDTSNITNMERMFFNAERFNQPLNFDTSNVTNMRFMFGFAREFNQPLNWDTSNVTNMEWMFYFAEKFNQPINFDTSNVVDMNYMFYNTSAFINRYNNGKPLPDHTDEIKKWINNNRDKMNEIDIKENNGKEIDDFFSKISNIESNNKQLI